MKIQYTFNMVPEPKHEMCFSPLKYVVAIISKGL